MSMRVSLIVVLKSWLDALLGWAFSWVSSQAWSPRSGFAKALGAVVT